MKFFKSALMIAAISGFTTSGAMAANKIVMDGSTTVGPIAKSFASYFTKKTGIEVTVSESGSGNGAKSLINKTCDIANMSRPMKDNELAAAKASGVTPVANIIALDGIAVIVHPSNQVKGLTKEQLAGVYTGKYTNWSQVGGRNVPIVVIQRESNSGTQETFHEMVVGKENKIITQAETQASNGAVKSRVSTTPNAIAFVGHGFVDKSVKPVAIDGIASTVKTIKAGTYPISRPLFMYTNGKPTGSVKQMIDLPKTKEGKSIISELGFVNKY
ncbi:MAG: PstS family phosphate ABC transporter substrate-binding protein [Chlorobiaceae bacterium]|nr:PstS family phosphate ABC transporter substrate-binding protein [Chlorobiaceae bacterium]